MIATFYKRTDFGLIKLFERDIPEAHAIYLVPVVEPVKVGRLYAHVPTQQLCFKRQKRFSCDAPLKYVLE